MPQHTLRTKHLLVILAVELDLLALMDIAGGHRGVFGAGGSGAGLADGEASEDGVIDWEVVYYDVVLDFIEGALDDGVFVDLL